VFVLGDATFVAPLLLFQIVVYSPIALTILDLTALRGADAEKLSLIDTVTAPFKNPIVLAGAAGLIVALIGWVPPRPLMQPFELIGATSVPDALLAFGLSLYGVRVLEKGSSPRRDVALASTLKIVVQPVLAYLMAHFLLGIDGHQLFAIVVVSTLPTAQNVFIYASRYRRGIPEALRRRLSHGNVYSPERVDAALGNYFRRGNLTALRELALLWVADQVDAALAKYRAENKITDTWEARERVVVAVTGGPESETLVRRASRIASKSSAELMVVHVVRGDGLTGVSAPEMGKVRALAVGVGATLHTVVGDDVPSPLLEFAREENATQLVLGTSRRSRLARILDE
ncbi:universal stress protein, partial [Streptomyces sp. NPDC002130]|uniref:universal stress protein n=1 Tax=Streptomyces sp. NPDC002130 TaxID=3155568 RepID=UPI00331AE6F7